MTESRSASILICVGAGLFIFALTVSAIVVPALRLLHVFQALIYVAVIVLTRRASVWGFGIGVFIATAWNGLQFFVSHLIQAGAGQLWLLMRTGTVSRPDTLMVAAGGAAHCVLIVGCAIGFIQLRPGMPQWSRFVAGGLLALAYFGLIVALLLPRT
jgi:hypothetical protein